MKRVIRIDRALIEVTVGTDEMTGVTLAIEVDTPHMGVSFHMDATTASKLAESLYQAAWELDEERDDSCGG